MRVLFAGRDPAELDRVLAESDFIAVTVPLSSDTRHMIGAEEMARMKPGAILVNTSRGPVVDEQALAAALKSGHLGGAGLDVFAEEPLDRASPLWDLPNVLLTPHMAGHGPYLDERRFEIMADNCRAFAAGQPLRNPVDKASWF